MNVTYYPANWDGPGCYRIFYPADHLNREGGHTSLVGTHKIVHETPMFLAVAYLFDQVPVTDLYVLQMPMMREYVAFMKHMKKLGKKVIVETDDDYLDLPDYNPAKKATKYDPWKPDKPSVLYYRWCLQHADAVTVTTPALKKSVEKVTSAPVYVLRNFTDTRIWRQPVYENRTWDKFRIGYCGMTTWHSGDLQEISWIGEWMKDNPEVEFVAQGKEVFEILNIPEPQQVLIPQFAFRHQKLYDHISCMDVGLVPLVRNNFNEAKSHLKGLEYAGAGIPCIATGTESYRDWWLAGDSGGRDGAGFVANGRAEWVHALDSLASDPDLRVRMGRRARDLAAQHSIQNHWRLWETAYLEVLNEGGETTFTPAKHNPDPDQKPAELHGLKKHLEGFPLNTVVEIGTAAGGTLKVWCELAARDATIVSVDLPEARFSSGTASSEDLLSLAQADQTLQLIRGDSHKKSTLKDLQRLLGGREVDLLFIDGDHTYEGVKKDWDMYAPLVREGGKIVFHDISDHGPEYEGVNVKKLWDQLKKVYTHEEYIDTRHHNKPGGKWGGIGVLTV